MRTALLISLGAILGANARYWLGLGLVSMTGPSLFPWPTFFVNLSGSALLGIFLGFIVRLEDPSTWRLAFAVGFCGSYTTFSTFSSEALSLLREGAVGMAGVYLAGSMIGGIMTIAAGYVLGRALARI